MWSKCGRRLLWKPRNETDVRVVKWISAQKVELGFRFQIHVLAVEFTSVQMPLRAEGRNPCLFTSSSYGLNSTLDFRFSRLVVPTQFSAPRKCVRKRIRRGIIKRQSKI